VAHLAAIEGRVPFINFFDGFRTSHEIQKIAVWDYADLKEMCDMDAVKAFRKHALNPERPAMRGSHENGDIFFQHREACNKYYDALPAIVEKYMGKVNAKLGTNYQLFNYYGAPDADRVIIAMGSICDVAEEVIDYLTAKGEKVGLVKVRLYRPFAADKLLAAIPATARRSPFSTAPRSRAPRASRSIWTWSPRWPTPARTTSRSSAAATAWAARTRRRRPSSPCYDELRRTSRSRQFTIGIVDDVTHLSLEESPPQHRGPPAPSSASSGAWAATAPSAPTRTPSRSSATTPTSTSRRISSTTPRRPAA
jgi:pyruvate-ferredoxin/flavodoxin oxidoreductase